MTEHGQSHFTIRELEVSITSRCSLACANCGFLVPDQPEPTHGEPIAEIGGALDILARSGARVRSLAVLGGEPTIDGRLLERALSRIAATGIAERLEVVTNGLTPRGLTGEALKLIDRLSISSYGLGEMLLEQYRTWLQLAAPHIELVVRTNDDGWDPWAERHEVSPKRAQEMYDNCWYRRHCVTVERGRLFVCSRIAKLANDDEGLLLGSETTLEDIIGYLAGSKALASCATCTPMMGLPPVAAGVQPDGRIQRLEALANTWLESAIRDAKGQTA